MVNEKSGKQPKEENYKNPKHDFVPLPCNDLQLRHIVLNRGVRKGKEFPGSNSGAFATPRVPPLTVILANFLSVDSFTIKAVTT